MNWFIESIVNEYVIYIVLYFESTEAYRAQLGFKLNTHLKQRDFTHAVFVSQHISGASLEQNLSSLTGTIKKNSLAISSIC